MSDYWYTPTKIVEPVIQVLGEIDLDPCADDGKHIQANQHFTIAEDGLNRKWSGKVFLNPPYSCPGKWMKKLQAEIRSERVTEAIALLPAATDTGWLSPILKSQPVCFWKGRIKFLDQDYQPRLSARQSHLLIYWGNNLQKFREIFQNLGVVMNADRWNPEDFGYTPRKAEGDQLTVFYDDSHEPPDPEDYGKIEDYEMAWSKWELKQKDKTMTTTFQFSQTQEITNQIAQLQEQLNKLTGLLRPYQECEQKAEELRLQVAEYGHEMTAKGISQSDISRWAKALYEAATCSELSIGDTATIAAQNEEISKLKAEQARFRKELDKVAKERNNALSRLAKMAQGNARIGAKTRSLKQENKKLQILAEQSDSKAVEVLQKENATLFAKIKSLEALTNQMDAELIEEPQTQKVEEPKQQVAEDLKANKGEQEEITDDEARRIGREYIATVKTKAKLNNLTWEDIRKVCRSSNLVLREMSVNASTKNQKELIDRMPQLVADYVVETGDNTDLKWIGSILKSKIEAVLKEREGFKFKPQDFVRDNNGKVWQVHNFDGEWLSVKQDNQIAQLNKSEVELIEHKIAA